MINVGNTEMTALYCEQFRYYLIIDYNFEFPFPPNILRPNIYFVKVSYRQKHFTLKIITIEKDVSHSVWLLLKAIYFKT